MFAVCVECSRHDRVGRGVFRFDICPRDDEFRAIGFTADRWSVLVARRDGIGSDSIRARCTVGIEESEFRLRRAIGVGVVFPSDDKSVLIVDEDVGFDARASGFIGDGAFGKCL